MRRFARSVSHGALLLLLFGLVAPEASAAAPESSTARAFQGVWYRTPEKRGTVAVWLASGSLTVGADTISFESKKLNVTIATKSIKSVESAQLQGDPVHVWIVVEYDEGGSPRAAAFKDAGPGKETHAIQAALREAMDATPPPVVAGGSASVPGPSAPASTGDVVHDVCAEVKTKKFSEQGREEKSALMAHLVCQIAAAGCRDNPGQEACKNTLRELDAHLKASGSSMLFAAAHGGRTDICKTMIEMGSDVNAPVATSWTPLMIAAAEGHETTVAGLLDAGADPNVRNDLGRTALMLASWKGFTPIVKELLERRADPNIAPTDKEGRTALMAAADSGHIETVEALLSGGADPAVRDKAGNTALELAETRGHSDVARLLKARGPEKSDTNR